MDGKRIVITRKNKLDKNKVSVAAGLSKEEQLKVALNQEQKLKSRKKFHSGV